MSRVAKVPIEISAGVEVLINDSIMVVKGKLGQMQMEIHPSVVVTNIENILTFDIAKVDKKDEKKHGHKQALQEQILLTLLKVFWVGGRRH